jgi:heterodisulfide reductase subunit C
MGDINKDSKINISDVIATIRHISAKEGSKYYLNEEKRIIADINQDGKINIADVIGIIRLISGNNKN